MKNTIDYIIRWLSTKVNLLFSNSISAAGILTLTCIAVKNNVFVEFGATKACLFAVLMCNVWSGIFNSIGIFCSEQDYIQDDLNKFLPVHSYVAGNVIIQFFQCLLEALLTASIFKLFFDYKTEGIFMTNRTIEYLVTFFLILFSADMLGFAAGLMIKKISSIMSAIPVILVAQLLFSGCLFELNDHFERLAYITTAKWGFYSLGSISDLNSMLPPGKENASFRPEFDYITYCWRYMILLSVFLMLFSGIILYFKVNQKEN